MRITIEHLGGQVPVTGLARLEDGRVMTFYARHEAWVVQVGATEEEAEDAPSWVWSEPFGDRPSAAGYMNAEQARAIVESTAEMLARGIAPPRGYVGVPEDEVAARRFARMLVHDLYLYEGDAAKQGGNPYEILAAKITEYRAAFEQRIAAPLHHVWREELPRLEAELARRVVHAPWLYDVPSAASVGLRWNDQLRRTPAARRAADADTARRWLRAWSASDDVRAAALGGEPA